MVGIPNESVQRMCTSQQNAGIAAPPRTPAAELTIPTKTLAPIAAAIAPTPPVMPPSPPAKIALAAVWLRHTLHPPGIESKELTPSIETLMSL